jgi:hypothetical protein
MNMSETPSEDGRKEAVKTYIEQTKLLVALASAFVIAPAAFAALFKDRVAEGLSSSLLFWFVASDVLFIASVLAGYVVLGTIAGFQHLNEYNVYRPATKYASRAQIAAYLIGMVIFIYVAFVLINTGAKTASAPFLE